MAMKKCALWLGVILLTIICTAWASGPEPPAQAPSFYVQDNAGVLQPDVKQQIHKAGTELASKTKAQVVVVTVKSLEGVPIRDYALKLFRQMALGDKELNNGVLLVVAPSERKSCIEVGYGLEGILPDAKTGRIQDEYMIPYFAKGDYNQGIVKGYNAVVAEVLKDSQPKQAAQPVPVLYVVLGLLAAGGIFFVLFRFASKNSTVSTYDASSGPSTGNNDSSNSGGGGSAGGGGSERDW